MVGSNETPDASRSLIAFIKSGLDSALEAGATRLKTINDAPLINEKAVGYWAYYYPFRIGYTC